MPLVYNDKFIRYSCSQARNDWQGVVMLQSVVDVRVMAAHINGNRRSQVHLCTNHKFSSSQVCILDLCPRLLKNADSVAYKI